MESHNFVITIMQDMYNITHVCNTVHIETFSFVSN